MLAEQGGFRAKGVLLKIQKKKKKKKYWAFFSFYFFPSSPATCRVCG